MQLPRPKGYSCGPPAIMFFSNIFRNIIIYNSLKIKILPPNFFSLIFQFCPIIFFFFFYQFFFSKFQMIAPPCNHPSPHFKVATRLLLFDIFVKKNKVKLRSKNSTLHLLVLSQNKYKYSYLYIYHI
jgi:hypothetical protein